MQQGGGGGGGEHRSPYGEMGPTTDATSSSHMVSEPSEQLEEASPISYRPPAIGSSDELMKFASGGGDDEGGGSSGGNRWSRQETLSLLKIRSDMDTVFRDASIKGPLWENVSRKLAELGYKRSAKKCKEKFENVQKYYKRTKDGRAGRQDGKTYKFFTELEALHHTTSAIMSQHVTAADVAPHHTTSATMSQHVTAANHVAPHHTTSATMSQHVTAADVAPISVGIPMSISSVRITPTAASTLPMPGSAPPPVSTSAPAPPITITSTATPFGISFSSNTSSSSRGYEDEDELGDEPSNMAGTSRKRKRQSSSSSKRMMEFLECLMKQVMQKQEALQKMFLEAIEKREQDRMIREEAWKRQEMARLAREHQLVAQERGLASSRDAAIVSFLQKITGQTIQLPTTVTIPDVLPSPTQPVAKVVPPPTPIPVAAPPLHQLPSTQLKHQEHQPRPPPKDQNTEVAKYNQQPIATSEVIMAIPEQNVAAEAQESNEAASSRWPKAEVLALINIRSGLETRYQEAGPKGPLWEEISAAMSRMGYKRNPKRCKEKWENINKYYKKVKESNKKRPEDAKTCPYFHQLDALYRKKILGGGSSSFSYQNRLEGEKSQHQDPLQQPTHDQSENKSGAAVDVFGKGNGKATKKSHDIVRELMEEQEMQ